MIEIAEDEVLDEASDEEALIVLHPEAISLKDAIKDIFNHSFKFIGCRLIYLGGTMANLTFLGEKGFYYLGASSLITTTQISVLYSSTGVIFAVGVFAKGAIAEGRLEDVGEIYRQGMLISAIVSVPAVLATYFMSNILSLTDQSPDFLNLVNDYNVIYMTAVPANTFFMNNLQVLLATSDYKAILAQVSLFSLIMLPCSYGFVNGAWGFPDLGASGAGLAATLAAWGSVIPTTLYIFFRPYYRKTYGITRCYFSLKMFKDLLKKGINIGLQAGIETIYLTLLSQILGKISATALSASAPIWDLSSILTSVTFSLAHVGGVLTRKVIGRGDFAAARTYGFATQIMGQIMPISCLIIFFAATTPLLEIFLGKHHIDSVDFDDLAAQMLYIYGVGLIPDSVRNIAAGNMRGYNDTLFAMLSGFVNVLCLGLLISGLLGFESPLGGLGALLGRTLAFTIGACVMGSYWYTNSRDIQSVQSLQAHEDSSLWFNVKTWMNAICCCRRRPALAAPIADVVVVPADGGRHGFWHHDDEEQVPIVAASAGKSVYGSIQADDLNYIIENEFRPDPPSRCSSCYFL